MSASAGDGLRGAADGTADETAGGPPAEASTPPPVDGPPPQLRLHLECDNLRRDQGSQAGDRAGPCAARQRLLEELRDALRRALLDNPSSRSEARMWLTTAVGTLAEDGASVRRSALTDLLPRQKSRHAGSGYRIDEGREPFVMQLLQLLCEDRAPEVGRVLAGHPRVLERFFSVNRSALLLWFGQFSMSGISHFRHGARGLARYSLNQRDQVWQHLVWEGKHPQAPVSVASKPHYFCELDVSRSVQNLLDAEPGFLSSEEMGDCIARGDMLALDYAFFTKELCRELTDGTQLADGVYNLLWDLLEQHDLKKLCHRLLHLLPSNDMLKVVMSLRPRWPLSSESAHQRQSLAMSTSDQWGSFEELLLMNTLERQASNLYTVLTEEENSSCLAAARSACEGLHAEASTAGLPFWQCLRKAAAAGSHSCELVSLVLTEAFACRVTMEAILAKGGMEALAKALEANGVSCKTAKAPGGWHGAGHPITERERSHSPSIRKRKRHKHDKKPHKKKRRKHRRSRGAGRGDDSDESELLPLDHVAQTDEAVSLTGHDEEWHLGHKHRDGRAHRQLAELRLSAEAAEVVPAAEVISHVCSHLLLKWREGAS